MNNMEYKDQVLSIEQMIELESVGIDTSDASCMWTSIQDNDYNPIRWLPVFRGEDRQTIEFLREKFPLTYKEGNVYYCYTLSDLIKKIRRLSNQHIVLSIGDDFDSNGYRTTKCLFGFQGDPISERNVGLTPIDVAFNFLKNFYS